MAVTLKQKWEADLINSPTQQWRLTFGSNPMTVTAGATLVVILNGFDSYPPDIIAPPLDSAGTFVYDTTARSVQPTHQNTNLGIAIQPNAAGGSHTITPALWASGTTTGGDGTFLVIEVTGVATVSPVRGSSARMANNSLQTWSVSTDGSDGSTVSGSAPQAGDVIFAAYVYENSVAFGNAGIPDPPPGGWISLAVQQDATNNLPAQFSYKILSSGGPQTATWTSVDTGIVTNLAAMLWLKAGGPTINVQPKGYRGPAVSNTFTVSATAASGTLSYQWQSFVGGSWNDIPGATSADYTVTVAPGSAYVLRCQVMDSAGATTSDEVDVWAPVRSYAAFGSPYTKSNRKSLVGSVRKILGSSATRSIWNDSTFGTPTLYRALVLVAGQIRQMLTSELGTNMKILVWNVNTIAQRAAAEGFPLVLVNGNMVVLPSGGTLQQ